MADGQPTGAGAADANQADAARRRSLEAAAHWYAVLLADDASAAERAAWQHWFDASESHRQAWAEIQAIGQQLQPLQSDATQRRAASQALQTVQRSGRSRRNVVRSLAWCAGSGLTAWLTWQHTPLQHSVVAGLADWHTGLGETRELRLADGTRVWLNTESALDVAYSDTQRQLHLKAGEVLVETAQDARSLVLQTRHGHLRPLGTRFAVRLLPQQTQLNVYEGAVRIDTGQGQASATLQAGQEVRFDQRAIGPIASLPNQNSTPAWTQGVLVAHDMPLAQLAAELQRYRRGRIRVAPEVAQLRVLGSYPLQDTDLALQLLEQAVPIRVRRPLPWWVVLEPR